MVNLPVTFGNGGVMKELIGKMTASLARDEQSGHDELMAILNANIKPPEPIESSMVYIRAMYIVSDRVNSYGGRFPAEDHDRLAELLIDSPVLVGHRKDSLPIARNFHAEKVARDGANWIKVYFYWLKNADGGENLRRNIDAGIYKEGSISFVFALPQCTICGRDIRDCPHQPFVKYKTPTGMVTAAFNYRKIERVLETSLVYRGSVENTSIEKALAFDLNREKPMSTTENYYPSRRRFIIWDPASLDPESEYLVFPAYESIPFFAFVKDNMAQIRSYSGQVIESIQLRNYLAQLTWPDGAYVLGARLIGYRGKERQPLAELSKYLHDVESTVTRVELKLYDIISMDNISFETATGRERRAALTMLFDKTDGLLPKSIICRGSQLATTMADVTTRLGCEIFGLDNSDRFLLTHRKLITAEINDTPEKKPGARSLSCFIDGQKRNMILEMSSPSHTMTGGTVILEVNALYESDGRLVALHPKVIDRSDYFDGIDDLAFVTSACHQAQNQNRYSLYNSAEGIFLELTLKGTKKILNICNYSTDRLKHGRRFFAHDESVPAHRTLALLGRGRVENMTESAGGLKLKLTGPLDGAYFIRPAIIKGRPCFLFGRGKDS
jgi:hypothetical protein